MNTGIVLTSLLQYFLFFNSYAQGDNETPKVPTPKLESTCDLRQNGASFFYHLTLNEDFFPLNEYQGHEYDYCFMLMQKTVILEVAKINENPWDRKVGETGEIKFSDGVTTSVCSYKIIKERPTYNPLEIISFKNWVLKHGTDGDILFDFLYTHKKSLDEAVEITCENMFLS